MEVKVLECMIASLESHQMLLNSANLSIHVVSLSLLFLGVKLCNHLFISNFPSFSSR
jgi:hypothetical protein